MFKKLPLLLLAATCLVAVIINSCKKDAHTDQQNKVSDPVIAQAKSWYESTYPTGNKLSSQAITGKKDWSQLIKPDWQHTASYSRFNQQVIEMPVDPSVKFASAIKNMTTGQTTNQNYSRSSYILLNNGTNYDAYVMTLIADSAYIKNDLGKLARNTYSKREADFSGLVLYYTPNGKYVSGWRYKDGHIVVPGAQTATPGTKVQSTGNSKLKPDNMVVPEEDCYDYYDLTYVNGILVLVEYQYSRCFSSGSGGGGGDSGYTPPPPCPPGTTHAQSAGHLAVNNMPPPPPDDGGFPPPAPTGPCVVVVPPPGSGDTNDSDNIVSTDCGSFNFTKTSIANWQEAGVRQIRLKWVWLEGNNIGQTRTVYLPSVVFGLPTQYQNSDGTITNLSSGAAAVKAAKATEAAKILTYVEFRNSPYFPSDAEVLQYFKGALATTMAAERGTAGATGSGNSGIIFQNEERSDFFPYSCN